MIYNSLLIGSSIQTIRKEKSLTQIEMAEALEISVTHYARIEEGKNAMSFDIFYRIMQVLDVDANTLLKDQSYVSNSRVKRAFDKLYELRSDEREKIVSVLELMLDFIYSNSDRMVS